MAARRPQPAPPPSFDQAAQGQDAGSLSAPVAGLAVGGVGAGAGVGAGYVAGAVTAAAGAAAIAKATKAILAALVRFFRRKNADDLVWLVGALRQARAAEGVTDDELRAIARDEIKLEQQFQKKAMARWAAALPRLLAIADPQERNSAIAKFQALERHYLNLRQQAMVTRADSRIEQRLLKELSPRGAYWKLSPFVMKSTPDCIALAGKVWPWSVIDAVGPPPRHFGCACTLYGVDEAKAAGWITDAQVPTDEHAALRQARDLLRRAEKLEEAVGEHFDHWAAYHDGKTEDPPTRVAALALDHFLEEGHKPKATQAEEAAYEEHLHPRNRLGRWAEVLKYNPHLPGEARNSRYRDAEGKLTGHIEYGPKFLDLPARQQEHVLAHEIGHDLDDDLLRDPHSWVWDEWNWADRAFEHLMGGPNTTPGERIADAYAAAFVGSVEDAVRWPAVLRIAQEAKARGLPIHERIEALLPEEPNDEPGEVLADLDWRAGYEGRRRWEALPDDAWVWLFHATRREDAEAFAQRGIDPLAKPRSLARERYEAGEHATFQPGAGVGGGLYVSPTAHGASGYGRELLAVKVRKRDVIVPPEQHGATVAMALGVSDAMVARAIPPEHVRRIETGGRELAPEAAAALLREPKAEPARRLYGATPERLADFAAALHRLDRITRADVEAGRVPGVAMGGLAAGVAGRADLAEGTITLTPSSFNADGTIDSVHFAHEVGHFLVHAVLRDGKVPPELEAMAAGHGRAEGRYGKIAGEGARLFGPDAKLPEEFIADSYADLIHGRAEFSYVPGLDGPDDPESREAALREFDARPQTRWLRWLAGVAGEHGLPDRGLWRFVRDEDGIYRLVARELQEAEYDDTLHPRGRLETVGHELPRLEWVDPPPLKPRTGERKAGGFTATGQTTTKLGDLIEGLLVGQLGLRSLLPEGGRQSPLDAGIGEWGFEVKVVTTAASELKIKPKKHEVASKVAYAQENGLTAASMIVVVDVDAKRAWAYWREGIGAYRLTREPPWHFMGSLELPAAA
jgi:hypothetical protein